MKYKEYEYPFSYILEKGIILNIEQLDDSISSIWFNNEMEEEQHIPDKFNLYESYITNSKNNIIKPYRKTQTYAISKNGNYTIEYNNKEIIKLETHYLLCSPPIIENKIIVMNNVYILSINSDGEDL